MSEQIGTIPVGTSALGRVLNASGEPLDKRGPISGEALRLPVDNAVSMLAKTGQAVTREQLFETGIKAIDLSGPIPSGGVIGMVSTPGLGKMVVAEEVMHNFITHHNGYVVFVFMGEQTYESSEMRDMVREIEVEDRSVMLFEQMTNDARVRRQLVEAALTVAAHFRDEGHEVMLMVGEGVLAKEKSADLQELKRVVRLKAITTLLFEMPDDSSAAVEWSEAGNLDGVIVFNRDLPKQNLWPAIDRLATGSRLLESGALSEEHRRVAGQVKQLLRRYYELVGKEGAAEAEEAGKLSEEDQQVIRRAQKVQQFLTQPFFVAEAYTDIPGEYVRVEDTIRGCKELLEGRYDDVPDKAFWFVGTVEQALEKGKRLGGE